ncbi:subclass B3 metallo-beta-lactamase [uncultured Erythrobacter sp.]|uniref:subclass B3 metallo-beta-lactamase n=1 Tax=uncultured Erythrobacter sp. TaxID=263913 RepID=UPI00260CE7D2|nr:subclass B3 metallo-beta-lactamase [uncultured Erythrobacter sp.]
MFVRILILAAGLTLASCATSEAQTAKVPKTVTPAQWAEGCEPWDEWDKPAPPFQIHGNTYYVGTCGISSILIVGKEQHFLLDTGTEAGSEVVLGNIRKLGVEPFEIFAVGYSHEHFDHVGGMANVIEATGANLVSSPAAETVFNTGKDNPIDPQSGMHEPMAPVAVEMLIDNGETIIVDDTVFTAIFTPGHTPGALSWHWESCVGEDCKSIVYADSLSPVSRDDYKFSDHPDYIADYRAGLERLRKLACDILLTPHPSASQMLKRATSGTFEGGMTCEQYADAVEKRLDARLAQEAAGE